MTINKLLDVIEEKNNIILVANHKIIKLEKKIEDKNIQIMRLQQCETEIDSSNLTDFSSAQLVKFTNEMAEKDDKIRELEDELQQIKTDYNIGEK